MEKETVVLEKLEKLGFKVAGAKVKELGTRKRKMALAYEHYRFVRQDRIDAFNKKLRDNGNSFDYKRLSFTPVEDYPHCPPEDVLDKMGVAVDRQIFDHFEVAHIIQVKDPILFGRVKGCPDRFFIGQWDDDCRIEDILGPNEG